MSKVISGLERIGAAAAFAVRVVRDAFRTRFELPYVIEELALSRDRTIVVRNYIHERFHLDSQNIGTVPLRGVPPPSTQKNSWNGICLLLLPQA